MVSVYNTKHDLRMSSLGKKAHSVWAHLNRSRSFSHLDWYLCLVQRITKGGDSRQGVRLLALLVTVSEMKHPSVQKRNKAYVYLEKTQKRPHYGHGDAVVSRARVGKKGM